MRKTNTKKTNIKAKNETGKTKKNIEGKTNKGVIITLIISMFIIIGLVLYLKYGNKEEMIKNTNFILDNDSKYIFTTDSKIITLQNDGGSNTSVYYEIDLDKKLVLKCEDKYIGFKGYEYKGKVLDVKEISNKQSEKIKEMFETFTKEKDKEKNLAESDYKYYTLSTYKENEIMVNDYAKIKEFLKIVE